MPSNPQSRIITPKTRRLSRRTFRVPVLPYQRQGRKLRTPGRGNRRLLFSLGELGEWLSPENTGRRVRRSEEKQGEQKKFCHLNHRWGGVWWGGRKDGSLRIHMHAVQIRDWFGIFLKLRKSRPSKIGGGLAALRRVWPAIHAPFLFKGPCTRVCRTAFLCLSMSPFCCMFFFPETRFTENRSATFVLRGKKSFAIRSSDKKR